jgi:hypothetical protein
MNISRRVVVSILAAAIILFGGLLFWPFILSDIIKPTALVVWLLLRVLVLSIDQKYFWGAIVFVVVILLFRLLPQEQLMEEADDRMETNATLRNIEYWRILFIFNGIDVREEKSIKRELTHLLTSIYVSKQHGATHFAVYDALQKGEIPLPEHIHSFLFAEPLPASKHPIKRFLQSTQKSVQRWAREWTGQAKAEHQQMIDEVLSFMETSLEIKNDE